MESQAERFHDQVGKWHCAYRNHQIDAMILLAHEDKEILSHNVSTICNGLNDVACILASENGSELPNRTEHFGYAGKINDPRFFKDSNTQPLTKWNPQDAQLNLVLTRSV